MAFHVPERFRVKEGPQASDSTYGNNGLFILRLKNGIRVQVIASDGAGWDHVSISLPNRCPSWGEMCEIKDLFWGGEDAVIQIHPKSSEYVTLHPFCLHLWRCTYAEMPLPHSALVGPVKGQSISAAINAFEGANT